MPNWNQILNEINAAGSTYDIVRRRYLQELHKKTGRNIIAYYSGWLQKTAIQGVEINDEDKNGFMTVIHEMDRSLGLDLILHTPGGDTAATESIVHYLRSMFGTNMRAIVPQIAMSGGTMIACACREIIMGKPSNLGPIDPHFGGIPAHGVLEEFARAVKEVKEDPGRTPIWQAIVAKYSPSFLGECQKAYEWATEVTAEWLASGMFSQEPNPQEKASAVVKDLADHALTKSHSRHLHVERCREIGLKISILEDDQDLQEKVLSVHHAFMLTLSATPAYKIIENHKGMAFIKLARPVVVAQG
jgi:ATP-dependent protease ClpP protease subunit